MLYRLVVGLIAAVGLLVTAVPALADPPVTTTTNQKGLVETFVDVVPSCEGGGPLYTITTTSNLVEHETVFADGRVHATFTQTGKFSRGAARGSEPAELHGSLHGLGRLQRQRQDSQRHVHFQHAPGRLGRIEGHESQRDHFNGRPDGSVNEFFHCH